MAIVIEATRKQVFPVEIEPRAFVRAHTFENLAALSMQELEEIAMAVNSEIQTRGMDHDK